MTCLSQVLIQDRENGHTDHRHGDGNLQGLERHTEQQEGAQAGTEDRESDRGHQASAVVVTYPNCNAACASGSLCGEAMRRPSPPRFPPLRCSIFTDRSVG